MDSAITISEMEKYVPQLVDKCIQKVLEEFVEKNEISLKVLSLIERVVGVEGELKSLREISDRNYESLLREMNARFEAMNKRFTLVQWMIGLFVGVPAFILMVIRLFEVLK